MVGREDGRCVRNVSWLVEVRNYLGRLGDGGDCCGLGDGG